MIYANIPQNIPQERRAEINRAILASLKTSAKKIPAETVYNSMPGKVTIGCTTISAVSMYERLFRELFADRPLFVIYGDVTFRCREKIIAEFEAMENGVLSVQSKT